MIAVLLTALLITQGGWADDRTPIKTVYPVYPAAAEFYGFTALCYVRFDIDAAGVPENVCAACNTGARGVDNQAIINTISGQFVQNAEASINQRRYAL